MLRLKLPPSGFEQQSWPVRAVAREVEGTALAVTVALLHGKHEIIV